MSLAAVVRPGLTKEERADRRQIQVTETATAPQGRFVRISIGCSDGAYTKTPLSSTLMLILCCH